MRLNRTQVLRPKGTERLAGRNPAAAKLTRGEIVTERTRSKIEEFTEVEQVANGGPPSLNRRGKKQASRVSRSAAKRGKRKSVQGGMHQRRNKRSSW